MKIVEYTKVELIRGCGLHIPSTNVWMMIPKGTRIIPDEIARLLYEHGFISPTIKDPDHFTHYRPLVDVFRRAG